MFNAPMGLLNTVIRIKKWKNYRKKYYLNFKT